MVSVSDHVFPLSRSHDLRSIFCADYLRGRSLKTDIIVRPNGTVTLTTRGRGKTAWRWLDTLKGKKRIGSV
jgi:hypothetical protein